jgi:hypothetical protein
MPPTTRSAQRPPAPPAHAVRRHATLAALALATLAACDDGTEPTLASSDATFTGRWAGRAWAATGRATLVRGGAAGDTLHLGGSWPSSPYPVQSLRIRLAPFRGAGTYSLVGNAVEMTDLVGGDAASSTYIGAEPTAGAVVIEAYTEGGVVRGTVSFRAVPSYGLRPYGASPTFEDGRFSAAVLVHTPGR